MSEARMTNWQKIFIILIVLAGLYKLAEKKLPPFERGLHETVVNAEAHKPAPHSGPMVDGCEIFPWNNVWNVPVDHLKVDPKSSKYIDSIGALKKLHPDFGSNPGNGIPFSLIPAGTRGVKVDFEYHDDSDLGNYRVPPEAPVEVGSDHHVILIDQKECLLYELYAAERQKDGNWKAGSGVKMDLTSNALRGEGKTSADAGGLPIFPGLVRYDEVASGEIKHALRFTVPKTQASFVWPARHFASRNKSPDVAPMGARFRLRADFDITKYPKQDQVILIALKRYGMFLADNGGPMFLSGVPDKRWDDDDIQRLRGVAAEDFEAVDESGLQMLVDSARADVTELQ